MRGRLRDPPGRVAAEAEWMPAAAPGGDGAWTAWSPGRRERGCAAPPPPRVTNCGESGLGFAPTKTVIDGWAWAATKLRRRVVPQVGAEGIRCMDSPPTLAHGPCRPASGRVGRGSGRPRSGVTAAGGSSGTARASDQVLEVVRAHAFRGGGRRRARWLRGVEGVFHQFAFLRVAGWGMRPSRAWRAVSTRRVGGQVAARRVSGMKRPLRVSVGRASPPVAWTAARSARAGARAPGWARAGGARRVRGAPRARA